jgi:hypothetical protein
MLRSENDIHHANWTTAVTTLCRESRYVACRVARWYIFQPKIQFWVIFGGSWNGRCLYLHIHIVWSFGLFYLVNFRDILIYFVVISYIFHPFWHFVPRKIWQPWSQIEVGRAWARARWGLKLGKNMFVEFEKKRSSLAGVVHCCKFRSRRIGSSPGRRFFVFRFFYYFFPNEKINILFHSSKK